MSSSLGKLVPKWSNNSGKSGCISFNGKKYDLGAAFAGRQVDVVYSPQNTETLTIEVPGVAPFQVRQLVVPKYSSSRICATSSVRRCRSFSSPSFFINAICRTAFSTAFIFACGCAVLSRSRGRLDCSKTTLVFAVFWPEGKPISGLSFSSLHWRTTSKSYGWSGKTGGWKRIFLRSQWRNRKKQLDHPHWALILESGSALLRPNALQFPQNSSSYKQTRGQKVFLWPFSPASFVSLFCNRPFLMLFGYN